MHARLQVCHKCSLLVYGNSNKWHTTFDGELKGNYVSTTINLFLLHFVLPSVRLFQY